MDGVHDLGGREGFGPVRWQADESGAPFHEEWEARAWGLSSSAGGHPSWTLDWFRHVRERIEPTDYLTMPYFDHWTQTLMAMLIDDGIADLDEVVSGHARFAPQSETYPGEDPADAHAYLANANPYRADVESAPAFAVGEKVRAMSAGHAHHTRLPAYVRGRTGTVDAHHGGRIFADASAQGDPRGEHLYTVSFNAADLWPEAEGRADRVYLDLWESYIERP